MSKHTNFRIGGPARWFVQAHSIGEIKEVYQVANRHGVSITILGGGSNMLVSDQGFEGVVLQIAMRTYAIEGTRVRADAGVLSSTLARVTARAGLDGLVWAISLPGTIGGAVRGNAGCFGGEMGDQVMAVDVLRDGRIVRLTKNQLGFSYRDSTVKHSNDVIVSVMFELKKQDVKELEAKLNSILTKRKTSQPTDAGSAGCLFKNYDIRTDVELQRLLKKFDLPFEMQSARCVSAGWLIDQMNLKGTQIGGAKISEIHGNFVVNAGSATAADVVQLAALIKTRARNEFGIQLQEEIVYVGF